VNWRRATLPGSAGQPARAARALTPADRSRLAHAAQSNNTEAVRMMLAAGWPVDVSRPARRDAAALGRFSWQCADG